MAKKKIKAGEWVMWLVSLVVLLAVGGSFAAGSYANVVILNYLPLLVHQIIGWALIIGVVIAFVIRLFKAYA